MDDETPDPLVLALRRLLNHRWELGDRDVTAADGVHPGRLAVLHGLLSHAYSLAEASIDLWDRPELRVAAVPLTRAIFETGLTAQWVAQVPEAAAGLVAAFAKQRHKMANSMAKVPGPLADAASDIRAGIPDISSSQEGVADSIASIAARFVKSDELYTYYRILCGPTHAGVEAADKWVDVDEDGGLRLLAEPKARSAREEFLAVYGLLLAAAAFEMVVENDGKRVMSFLDGVAQEVGLPVSLELKPTKQRDH